MMKRAALAITISLFVTSLASADTKKPRSPKAKTPRVTASASASTAAPPTTPKICPDVTPLVAFTVDKNKATGGGSVALTARVKNIGNAEYKTNDGQQSLEIWETLPGGTPTKIATRNFGSIAKPGEGDAAPPFNLYHRHSWTKAAPEANGSYPTYQIKVVFDANIKNDNNPDNDDCNATNDAATITPAEIAAKWAELSPS